MTASTTPIPERLAKLERITVRYGKHDGFSEAGCCALELVAWLAGEEHSDHPRCVCPVIGAFVRTWNDQLPDDAERARLLRPLLPLLVGTRAAPEVDLARAWLATDWLARTYAPAWLRFAGLTEHADALAALPPIDSDAAAEAAQPALVRARDAASAARSAAWSAAESAAESAAWSAAWSAAESAARSAAESAARSAAWSAAESAARSAAWSAAESAAWSVVAELQASAVDLVRRMVALGGAS